MKRSSRRQFLQSSIGGLSLLAMPEDLRTAGGVPVKKMKIVSFKEPGNYNLITIYADTIRNSFKDIQQNRPRDMKAVQKALADFLINCRFENCYRNNGYIKALGLKTQ